MRAWICGLIPLCVAARSFAQEPPPSSEPDFAKATELYNTAGQEMNAGQFDDATRDFLAAYEITKDPVLFFKIGSAYEKAGKCNEALGYYERYLNEAKPEENFVTLTRDRIKACQVALGPKPATPPAAQQIDSALAPAPNPNEVPPPMTQSKNADRAWLFVGGALAFVTAGAVLAYSANSAEQDVKDLYVSNNGKAPEFDATTKDRYDDLLAEGHRYEVLSWTSFGLAAACAAGATVFFLRDRGDVSVTPAVTSKQAGVSAMIRF
jgi:tetratricopeptide (TPR) repeat protein